MDSRGLSQNQAARTRLTEYSACIAVYSHWLLSILDKAESFVTVALKLNNDHHVLTSHLTLDDAPLIKDTPHFDLPSSPTSPILLSRRQLKTSNAPKTAVTVASIASQNESWNDGVTQSASSSLTCLGAARREDGHSVITPGSAGVKVKRQLGGDNLRSRTSRPHRLSLGTNRGSEPPKQYDQDWSQFST